jgi:hypothetical protein
VQEKEHDIGMVLHVLSLKNSRRISRGRSVKEPYEIPVDLTFIKACQQRLAQRPRFAKYHIQTMESRSSIHGYHLILTLQGKWRRTDFEQITTIIISKNKPILPDPQLGKFHNIVTIAAANAGKAVFTWGEESLP